MLNAMGIQMLRFADDIAIKAQEKINLKRALESLDEILNSNYRIKINRIKAEVIVCYKNRDNINIKLDDDIQKQVPKFKYLRSLFRLDEEHKEGTIQGKKIYYI